MTNTTIEITGLIDHARHLVTALGRLLGEQDAEIIAVLSSLQEKLTEAADRAEEAGA